jgi:hypothetical protein
LFAAAAAVAAGLILWLGRDASFSSDELVWFAQTPDLDLDGLLQPHVGHLLLTTRLVYAGIFEVFGVDYLPFQLLTIATVVLTAGLFYAYASRRVGRLAALAPVLVLLVFGADYAHVLLGNGFTVLGALACGIGALLAFERDDRRGDVIACGLLCLGVVTYTVALAFVVGIGVAILLRADRLRRLWIVAIPTVIYAAWWLWALDSASSSQEQVTLSDALLLPAWAFQSLGAVLGAVTGIDYDFGEGAAEVGSALALAAIVLVGLRLRRGPIPTVLWAALGVIVAYWLISVLGNSALRSPDSPRYMYPSAIGVLLVAAAAAAGLRWSRAGLITLFAVAVAGVSTNLILLRDGGDLLRAVADDTRADLGAIELAGESADPGFLPDGTNVGSVPTAFVFTALADSGEAPTATYLEATESLGEIGLAPEALGTLDDETGMRVDAIVARALALAPQPLEPSVKPAGCEPLGAETAVELTPGDSAVLSAGPQAATVEVRRFGESAGVPVGSIPAGAAATLAAPADSGATPWRLSSPDDLRICESP